MAPPTTLREELTSKGIGVTMASGKAAAPGAQLSVTEWNPGSRAVRYFVGFGSGEGHMTVVVDVTRADGGSAVQGEVRGYVNGGLWGRFIVAGAERGGEIHRERHRDRPSLGLKASTMALGNWP